MKRHYSFLIVLGVMVFFVAACSPTSEVTPQVVATATATAMPEPTTTPPTSAPTTGDLYCPKGNMSTDWCVCAVIGPDEGPIAALRRESGTEPHEMGSILGQVVEILVYAEGNPSRIERYDWETLLTVFNTTLQPGDVVCDAYRFTISEMYPSLEVIDYRNP